MSDFFKIINRYITEYMPRQKCFSKNTIRAHKNCLNMFVDYLRNVKKMKVAGITFAAVNREVITEFLSWLEDARSCSPASRNQRLSILRTFFEYAGTLDCTQVALELDVKKIPMARHGRAVVEYLSDSALQALLAQPDTGKSNGLRDRFFMMLLYDTGARVSELLDMHICDLRIDVTHPTAYLRGKGDKLRSVPIMPKTVEHCRGYLKTFHPESDDLGEAFLFYTTIHGRRHRMSAAAVGAFMKKYGELAKKVCPEVPNRVHPHQLRHTKAIHLYRDGYPLVLVGEYLGHVHPETTRIYAYADTEMKRKALEKVDNHLGNIQEEPIWDKDDDMILILSGLK